MGRGDVPEVRWEARQAGQHFFQKELKAELSRYPPQTNAECFQKHF